MNVLIVGGTSFMGYRLTWRLLAARHRVTLFNRGLTPHPFGNRVEEVRGDRRTEAFNRLLAGRSFDAIVDFAAYNGDDVRRVLSVFSPERAGQYVFISSGQVYPVRRGYHPPASEDTYEGETIPAPTDPVHLGSWEYGMGKREAEDVLASAWHTDGFPSTRLRVPTVNGERDPQHRVEPYLWRLVDGGPVLLPDGGQEIVRHSYVGSVVQAIAQLLGNPSTLGQVYNFCQDEMPTLAEMLDLVADHLGAPRDLVPVSSDALIDAGLDVREMSPFSSPWMSCIDPSRAKHELGLQHEPLDSYLGTMVAAWLAERPAGPPPSYARRDIEIALARQLT